MTGDHKLDAISTYPFPIFKNGWEHFYDVNELPVKGDIIIGNDVWLGHDSLIKNGVTIGDGAITTTTNKRSEKLMQRLRFIRSESEDFDHPKIAEGHIMPRHVFYRKQN